MYVGAVEPCVTVCEVPKRCLDAIDDVAEDRYERVASVLMSFFVVLLSIELGVK